MHEDADMTVDGRAEEGHGVMQVGGREAEHIETHQLRERERTPWRVHN